MTINKICYECGIPCTRAGEKLTPSTRECTGWKDKNFVGCCALESPEEAYARMAAERRKKFSSSKPLSTTLADALKKAGFI